MTGEAAIEARSRPAILDRGKPHFTMILNIPDLQSLHLLESALLVHRAYVGEKLAKLAHKHDTPQFKYRAHELVLIESLLTSISNLEKE